MATSQWLVIEGPAGMGKTRLVGVARAAARTAGLEVLTARAGELEQEFAFGVVRQLFEPLLARASADERAEFTADAAGLALPLFQRPGTAGQEAVDTSFAMLHGLYWLAANLALRRPALLAIDDLHWADVASLRWIAYLARRLEGLPLLVAVAARPPSRAPRRRAMGHRRRGSHSPARLERGVLEHDALEHSQDSDFTITVTPASPQV